MQSQVDIDRQGPNGGRNFIRIVFELKMVQIHVKFGCLLFPPRSPPPVAVLKRRWVECL